MTPKVLFFVRHGEVDNPKRVEYHRLPGFPLTEKGRDEAKSAGRYLAPQGISLLYCSPLMRTEQTAEIISTLCENVPIRKEERINEIGEHETPEECVKRMKEFYEEWLHSDVLTAAAVGHRDPFRLLFIVLSGLPPWPHIRNTSLFPMPTGSIYRVEPRISPPLIELVHTPPP
ncbi:MAG TPA: histidine phosphatase family protein [Fimbriimonadales bacterium]|nr:histidine phosphatase family protein [Fimbriimonadales bacterium]